MGALTAGGVRSEATTHGEAIVFPYRRRGTIVNRKHRAEPKKFWMDKGGELILWNLDCLQRDVDHVYIVEGEMDALSFIEAGIHNVVSVPNGAPANVSTHPLDPDQDEQFRYLWNCREELAGKRYVLAGDNDEAGVRLRDGLASRLQPENCDVVEWPEGCKDANEYLQEVGRLAFAEYVLASRKHYPVEGVFGWHDVLPTAPLDTYPVNIGDLGRHLRLARGTMSIVTGIPGMGKSQLAKQIVCQVARDHGWRSTIASFEDRMYRTLMPDLIQIMSGDIPDGSQRSQLARADAVRILANHVSFIADERARADSRNLEWFMSRARVAKVRYGTDLLVLDPWNEIEHTWNRDQTEAQYLNSVLALLRHFAAEIDVHLMIVAHPTKLPEGVDAPGLYNVSGGSAWANKADLGIVVHQPEFRRGPGGPTEVHLVKVKRPEYGTRGMVTLQFDQRSRRFEAP